MKYFMSCLLVILFFGCNEVNPKGEKEVRKFVKQWNDAHTLIKSPYLERHYMDVVNYYGTELKKNQVQEAKNLLFQKFPDYTQRVLNDDLVITKEGVSYLVTFTKHVKYNGKEANYVCYLSVMPENGVIKILREGIVNTNKNVDTSIFPSYSDTDAVTSNKRQLFGDFNGDGLSDYASVISPEIQSVTNTDTRNSGNITCKGACNSTIIFSNKTLEPISIKGAYKSQLENLKDLNSDGADEIGFWDIKPTTKTFYIFNALTGKLLCNPVLINTTVHRNLNLIDVFKKTGVNKITVTHSEQVNGKWLLKSEVIVLD
jgi:hypothetical protein